MSLFFSKWSPSSLPAVQGCSWSDLNPSLRTNHLHLTTWNSQQTYQAFHPCLFTRLHLGAVPLLRIFPRKLLLLSFMTQRQDSNVGRMIMRGEEREVEIALGKFLLICPVRFYFSVLCVPTTVFITFIQHSVFMYAFAWIFFHLIVNIYLTMLPPKTFHILPMFGEFSVLWIPTCCHRRDILCQPPLQLRHNTWPGPPTTPWLRS